MNNHVRKRTHNTANNDAPSSEMYYSCRSIVFGARQLIIYSAKSNGVVSRNVKCNWGASNGVTETLFSKS
jgi:hypothetical protein